MSKFKAGLGVDVLINDISQNPHCKHGPTILFERFDQYGKSQQFYACAACRDRKLCSFYLQAEKKQFLKTKDATCEKNLFYEIHSKKYRSYLKSVNYKKCKLSFCNTCSCLFPENELNKHNQCHIIKSLKEQQLQFPSQVLPPKDNAKCEAQYLFTEKSLQVIINLLKGIKQRKILCVGTPRIHEAIRADKSQTMNSILLDIDERFCNFFSTEEFVAYNMFNHYFFGGPKSQQIYSKFLKGATSLMIITDPPFGARMELIANTLKSIEREWKEANDLSSQDFLPVMLIFPYFMESAVLSNLPSFSMLDYKVDYDNHPLYTTGPKGMKQGSAVRLFVNLSPQLFPLPLEEGYSHCKLCHRWVHSNNVHCNKCGDCTSKDGRTYKHCDSCRRCVKPSWVHCDSCNRCQPQDHKCQKGFGVTAADLSCHVCGNKGHKRHECPKRKKFFDDELTPKKKKKKMKHLPQSLKEEKNRNLEILKQITEI